MITFYKETTFVVSQGSGQLWHIMQFGRDNAIAGFQIGKTLFQ